ncbi:MAG: hypothetical protein GYA51_00185 [Candidatus Methanofastidiosa archaeon]|jgi:hypothetical protein|nr:hypothetical protein [Candidatus Methanofastidiosa archaeon]
MQETLQQILSSFDANDSNETKEPDKPKETLEARFARERIEYSGRIKEMSDRMKDIFKVSELMVDIYTERQRAVEYYHYLISIFKKVSRAYTKEWSEKYQHYSFKSQVRFPNERTKELQILSEMSDIVEKREEIENHAKFISQTIGTIDNIIYGIKYKVEIEQISRGK